jgi:hypothetical protein
VTAPPLEQSPAALPSALAADEPATAADAAPTAPAEARPFGTDPNASADPNAAAQSVAPDEAAPGGAPAPAAEEPSAIATPTTEFHQTPDRFGGLPTSDSKPVAPSRPRLSVGKAISVITTRVGKDDSSDDKSGGAASPANCDVQILHEQPAAKTREVATLKVDGAPAQHEDILSLLKRKACEAGANAVLIKSVAKTRVEGVKVDHLEAVALIVGTPKPPVDPSPVPKTITVTPDGPAVPKTITVDPGAAP